MADDSQPATPDISIDPPDAPPAESTSETPADQGLDLQVTPDSSIEPEPQPALNPEDEINERLLRLENWALRSYLAREGAVPEFGAGGDAPAAEPREQLETEDNSTDEDGLNDTECKDAPLPEQPSNSALEFLASLPCSSHLTPAQKQKIVMREIEELKDRIQSEKNQFEERKDALDAERGALQGLADDLARDAAEFRARVEKEVDPRTGKIVYDAFKRHFARAMREKEATLHLLQLQTASQKSQARKLAARLAHRETTGESVRAIDFDQLRIENRIFSQKLEVLNRQLLEVRQTRAAAKKPPASVTPPKPATRKGIEYPPVRTRRSDAEERIELPGSKEFIAFLVCIPHRKK